MSHTRQRVARLPLDDALCATAAIIRYVRKALSEAAYRPQIALEAKKRKKGLVKRQLRSGQVKLQRRLDKMIAPEEPPTSPEPSASAMRSKPERPRFF